MPIAIRKAFMQLKVVSPTMSWDEMADDTLDLSSKLDAPSPWHLLYPSFLPSLHHPSNSSTTLPTISPNSTIVPSITSTLLEPLAEAEAEGKDSDCPGLDAFMPALPWIRIIFGLLMVAANVLSLIALWRVRRMQRAVHRFISSLAVAELLMGVWCCYRYSAKILMGSEFVTMECRLRYAGNTYLNFVAILSVCGLCFDRCLALHFPFRYTQLVTKTRLRAALAAVWILPLGFILTAYVDSVSDYRGCSFAHIASRRTYVVLTVLRCLLIGLIIVCELLIFRSARCQIIKIYPNVFSSRNSNRFLRMNAKAAITTLAVVLPFLLMYFPVLLVQGNLAAQSAMADLCQSQLLSLVWLIASAHGLLTPVVFCWRFTEVRQNLLTLLCCRSQPANSPTTGVFHLRPNEGDSSETV